jgi:hypothetical protein
MIWKELPLTSSITSVRSKRLNSTFRPYGSAQMESMSLAIVANPSIGTCVTTKNPPSSNSARISTLRWEKASVKKEMLCVGLRCYPVSRSTSTMDKKVVSFSSFSHTAAMNDATREIVATRTYPPGLKMRQASLMARIRSLRSVR